MPKLKPENKTEDGMVLGYVETDKQGSRCFFEICTIEEWEILSEEEAEKSAREALHESGVFSWGY